MIPVYLWALDEDEPWPLGAASRWWLHHSLCELESSLAKRNLRLVIREGPAAETLLALAAETGARYVFWNRRYEPAAIARDRDLTSRLRQAGLVA